MKYGPLLLLCATGVVVRIPFYLASAPLWSGDSTGYSLAWFFWSHGYFYLAERTPVYPMLLGMAQWLTHSPASPMLSTAAAYATVLLQSLLDLIGAGLVYATSRLLGVGPRIALAAGIFSVTIPGLCSMEMNILNLAPAFFWVTLGAACFVFTIRRLEEGNGYRLPALATGLVLCSGGLLRSEILVFLAVLLLAVLVMPLSAFSRTSRSPRARRWLAAALIAVAAAPPVLFWMTWNYVGIGFFRYTTLTGWNRSKTVYNLFHLVGPEDKVLGEILTASYHRRNAAGQINRDHIWQAQWTLGERFAEMPVELPALPMPAHYFTLNRFFGQRLGMTAPPRCDAPSDFCHALQQSGVPIFDYKLKDYLGLYVGHVSNKLIRAYPLAHLGNAADNFVRDSFNFDYTQTAPAVDWYRGFGVTKQAYGNPFLARVTATAIRAEAPLLLLLYLVTLAAAFSAPILLCRARYAHAVNDCAVACLALATVGTIVATCLLAGYNKEYSIEHLGVLVLCAAYAAEHRRRIASAFGARKPSKSVPTEEPKTLPTVKS